MKAGLYIRRRKRSGILSRKRRAINRSAKLVEQAINDNPDMTIMELCKLSFDKGLRPLISFKKNQTRS